MQRVAGLDKQTTVGPVDFTGKHFLVTGGRVKLGFTLALRLLRSGAKVTVTSRFPIDTRERYQAEHDYVVWNDNLNICELDMRFPARVNEFISAIGVVDVLINNAAQTIHRPDQYYAHLKDVKLLAIEGEDDKDFPEGEYDSDRQQVDLRTTTSWSLMLKDIPQVEYFECAIINAAAPFMLIQGIKVKPGGFIINISSKEGRFNVRNKSPAHVHTNMAKAALNMLTRTTGNSMLRENNVCMCAIDPGWFSEMDGAGPFITYEQAADAVLYPLSAPDRSKIAGKLLRNNIIEEW
jgi:NAD(P)-dependent dehydrogenase (short-subunit alcohol dehydrogenase family)